jgi:SLT domain-containing protein
MAINNWDSNAAAGTPSKGLMQTIDSTFNTYALPGHTNIWNPVDNIVAAVRYANATYGAFENIAFTKSGY